MLLTYVDESYDRQEYWLTALVVPDDAALSLQNQLDTIVRDASLNFGVPQNAELHGHPLFQAKLEWKAMKPAVRARINIYSAAMNAVADHGDIQIVMAGVDIPRLHRRYTTPLHPHREALDMLTQSVNSLARDTGTDFLAIADEIDESDTLRASYWDLQRLDTLSRYGGKLDRAVDALHFAPSRHSRLLQAADLVSFLHFRIRRSAATTDPRSIRASANLWDIISHKVHAETIRP